MQPEPLLVDGVRIRVVRLSDAERLSAAYQRNREHLAPWEPRRNEDFFTVAGQTARIESSWPCSSPVPMFRGCCWTPGALSG